MPVSKWVFAEDGDQSSDSDEDVAFEADQDDHLTAARDAALERLQGNVDLTGGEGGPSSAPTPHKQKGKISIKLGGGSHAEAVCHVCGARGHSAGFAGSVYIDCINKPCYLCGEQDHSTQTCPHRLAPELGCSAAADAATGSIVNVLQRRECAVQQAQQQQSLPPHPGRWHVDAAVLKLHNRRTTCLEFHPTIDNIVFSGDKRGQIATWDVGKVFERTVYPDINRWLTNGLRCLPQASAASSLCATSSYDGTVKIFDVETGLPVRTLVDANPCGWANVVEADKIGEWVTFIGLDVMPESGTVVAGDNKGRVYFLDPRVTDAPVAVIQAHKKGTKVQSVSANPVDGSLVLTAGNDYQARLLDARRLSSVESAAPAGKGKAPASCAAEVGSFAHPRVINAAYFSPVTGRKILSTCQDNRLRVWDNFGAALGCPPDREIVHSHTFNRHLTAFKAEFDPKDPSERLAVIGRYISEAFDGIALHPIDLVDVATGASVGHLADPNLATICPVNKPHPRLDLIVTGSSRSLYAWRPAPEDEEDGAAVTDGLMQGAALGNGSSSGAGSFPLRGSSNFMFFDADGGGDGKKRKKQGGDPKQAGKKGKKGNGSGGGGGSQEFDAGEDEDSD